jgi:signal transduction histidine kinase
MFSRSNLKRLTDPAKVKVWFIGALTILVGITLVSILNTRTLRKTSQWVAHTNEVISAFHETLSTLKDAETGQRGYLITGQVQYLEPYNDAVAQVGYHVRKLKKLTADDPYRQEEIRKLERLTEIRLSVLADGIRRRRDEGFVSAQEVVLSGEGKQTMDEIRALIAESVKAENDLLVKREAEASASTTKTIVTFVAGLGLSFALLLLVFYLLSHEIGQRRKAEEAAQRLAEQLEAANKELEAFSYSTSHDLRAPLRHVIGFAEMLQRNGANLGETNRRYITTIVESAQRMGNLIDHLLNFSRLGRSEMQAQTVDLDRLLKDVMREFHEETRERKVKWKIDPLGSVLGDAALLRLVITNLISNALKFTRDCPDPLVEIGCNRNADELVVFVRDNGAGFEMKYVDKLFGVFQRLHRAEEFEGTGIGLANVRRIIHRHGGRTWAEGALNRGATMYFSLPLHMKG